MKFKKREQRLRQFSGPSPDFGHRQATFARAYRAILGAMLGGMFLLSACGPEDVQPANTFPTPTVAIMPTARPMSPTAQLPQITPPAAAQAMPEATATPVSESSNMAAATPTSMPAATVSPVGDGAMVTMLREMNIRAGPSIDYPTIDDASVGQEFPITGKSSDGDWWQIDKDGVSGWIYGPYVKATNAENVPVVATGASTEPSTVAASANPALLILELMNVREGPGTQYAIVGEATDGQEFPINGKSADGDWWRIDFDGQAGWIYAPYVVATDTDAVPEVSGAQTDAPERLPSTPALAQASLTTDELMNVRGGPGTNYPVLGEVSAGQQFSITGKSPEGDWWQIDFNGQFGWIYGLYVTAIVVDEVGVVNATPTPPPTITAEP